uniref:Uncharacterized protein n=1 Tax=Parascaris univalens TaxID=6257 RepID=A0A914ZWH4_PARUN
MRRRCLLQPACSKKGLTASAAPMTTGNDEAHSANDDTPSGNWETKTKRFNDEKGTLHASREMGGGARESTKAWEQALLKHNCDLFHLIGYANEQPLAVAAFPTIRDPKTPGIQQTRENAVAPLVIAAQIHPTVLTTQHTVTADAQRVPFHRPVTFHEEGLQALPEASIFQQAKNFQNSSGLPSITPLLPTDNEPNFANHSVQVSLVVPLLLDPVAFSWKIEYDLVSEFLIISLSVAT